MAHRVPSGLPLETKPSEAKLSPGCCDGGAGAANVLPVTGEAGSGYGLLFSAQTYSGRSQQLWLCRSGEGRAGANESEAGVARNFLC